MGAKVIKDILRKHLVSARKKAYLKLYEKIIACNPELKYCADGEKEWLKKWRKYDSRLLPFAYRIFSRYIGSDVNIVPLELCVNLVEPILTPAQFLGFYNDKNSLDRIFPILYSPRVYIRNINGVFYDENYNSINNRISDKLLHSIDEDVIVLKPSLASSGVGVKIYKKYNGCFVDSHNVVLSLDFLKANYGCNYLITEFFAQSEVTSFFNVSSVNTIRIATYRDRKGMIHPLRSILRIGNKGANVDNAHAGGDVLWGR